MEKTIQKYKGALQNHLLFNEEEGFDKDNFRKKHNPEVDYDVVEEIVKDVYSEVLKLIKSLEGKYQKIWIKRNKKLKNKEDRFALAHKLLATQFKELEKEVRNSSQP